MQESDRSPGYDIGYETRIRDSDSRLGYETRCSLTLAGLRRVERDPSHHPSRLSRARELVRVGSSGYRDRGDSFRQPKRQCYDTHTLREPRLKCPMTHFFDVLVFFAEAPAQHEPCHWLIFTPVSSASLKLIAILLCRLHQRVW